MADFDRRRDMVRTGVDGIAEKAGGQVVESESLYDEVAALVEWPVPVLGSFDEKFLELPRECVISTLTGHQRYFPVADENDKLLPKFPLGICKLTRSPSLIASWRTSSR